jgi:hypothetical protein
MVGAVLTVASKMQLNWLSAPAQSVDVQPEI